MGTYDTPSAGSHYTHSRSRDAPRRRCMFTAVHPGGGGAASRRARRRYWACTIVRGAGSDAKHRAGRDGSVLEALEWARGRGGEAVLSGWPTLFISHTFPLVVHIMKCERDVLLGLSQRPGSELSLSFSALLRASTYTPAYSDKGHRTRRVNGTRDVFQE